MITAFHGTNAETHDAFQAWRQANPDGFHMTEKAQRTFLIHWTHDKRENAQGRGCQHQGVSSIRYLEDKDSCYTTARKICSESFAELLEWASKNLSTTKACSHCATRRFPFPGEPLVTAQ